MVARVTLADVDTVRVALDEAIELYKQSVIPAMQEQKGYEGVCVLATPEGRAMVITFWESAEASEAGIASGFYAEQGAEVRDLLPCRTGTRELRCRDRRDAGVTIG